MHGLGNAEAIHEAQEQFVAWVNSEIENTSGEVEVRIVTPSAPKRPRTTPLGEVDANQQIESSTVEEDKAPATKPWFGKILGLGGTSNTKKTPTRVWVWYHQNEGYSDYENTLVPIKKLSEELLGDCIPSFLKNEKLWLESGAGVVQAARAYFALEPGRRIGVQFGANVDNASVVSRDESKVVVMYDDQTTQHTKWDPIFSKHPWRFLHEKLDSPEDFKLPSLDQNESSGSERDFDDFDS